MPNSNRRTGFGRRSGTVTVIEEPVRRNAARTAKIVFYVTWIITGLLVATVAASKWHPIIALFAGAGIGLVTGLLVGAVIIAWPVIRALWWWAIEIIVASALVAGWIELADHTALPVRIVAVVLIVGVPAAIPKVRWHIVALAWCVITRHRLRTCFNEFIITNRTGSLPLILLARPTPAGVRACSPTPPGTVVPSEHYFGLRSSAAVGGRHGLHPRPGRLPHHPDPPGPPAYGFRPRYRRRDPCGQLGHSRGVHGVAGSHLARRRVHSPGPPARRHPHGGPGHRGTPPHGRHQ